jgi:predicted Zn-dependent protease with MMP-like domain
VRDVIGRDPRAAKVRRRDRHDRGLRGTLTPPGTPLSRTRSQRFDDLVLQAVAELEPRWEDELADVEFGVEEIPPAGPGALPDDRSGSTIPVPLARLERPATAGPSGGAAEPARIPHARIVLYRRPLLARADTQDELEDLILDVIVEELADLLGVDPEAIDPGYSGD